jgi:hypothetical protein
MTDNLREDPSIKSIRNLVRDFAMHNGAKAELLGLGPRKISKIISAAGIPLAGWEEPLGHDWLPPCDDHPILVGNRFFKLGAIGDHKEPLQSSANQMRDESWKEPPASLELDHAEFKIFWKVNSDGSFIEMTYCERGVVSLILRVYDYDQSWNLVQNSLLDALTNVNKADAIVVRTRGDVEKIGVVEVIGAIAALLAEFEKYRFSLGDNLSFSVKHAKRVQSTIERLLKHVRNPKDGPALNRFGTDMLAAAAEVIYENLEAAKLQRERSPRPKQARTLLIGALEACFRIIYGQDATTKFVQYKEINAEHADGPFVRFACAFLEAVGSPSMPNTVHSELVAWRKLQGRSKPGQTVSGEPQ